MHFLQLVVINGLAVWVSDILLANFTVYGGWKGYVIAAVVLALLNVILKPVLKILSAPLIILSLGLFTIVINGFILWLVAYFLPDYVRIYGLLTLFWATIIIAAFNMAVHSQHS